MTSKLARVIGKLEKRLRAETEIIDQSEITEPDIPKRKLAWDRLNKLYDSLPKCRVCTRGRISSYLSVPVNGRDRELIARLEGEVGNGSLDSQLEAIEQLGNSLDPAVLHYLKRVGMYKNHLWDSIYGDTAQSGGRRVFPNASGELKEVLRSEWQDPTYQYMTDVLRHRSSATCTWRSLTREDTLVTVKSASQLLPGEYLKPSNVKAVGILLTAIEKVQERLDDAVYSR